MSATYLVGYDGSNAARSAVGFAAFLAVSSRADVVAANVLVEQLGPGHWAKARAEATELLKEIDEDVGRRVVEGPTAHGLHDLAVELDASMLFVGATHRGTFGRMIPGSVGERLIHAAPCPLVIVPARAATRLATIGVAFDGRDASRTALDHACAIATEHHAKLVLLTVEGTFSSLGAGLSHPREDTLEGQPPMPASIEAVLDAGAALVPEGIDVEQRVLTGAAGPALVAACGEDIDLLVAGSRGYGPLHSVLVGDVARHLTDHAPCPLLLAPRVRTHRPGRHAAADAAVAAH